MTRLAWDLSIAWQHWAMTVSGQPDPPATSKIIVRDYAEADYSACRSLWVELTEYHRSIYGDSSIGGDDPGAGFDDYLAESHRMGSWVAETHGEVVGLTGLLDRGSSGKWNRSSSLRQLGIRALAGCSSVGLSRKAVPVVTGTWPSALSLAMLPPYAVSMPLGSERSAGTSTSPWTWQRGDMTG